MAPHTIRLMTPWEVVPPQNSSSAGSPRRLSLPISFSDDEFQASGKLVRCFHSPPALAQTARVFLRIVLDRASLCAVLNGTELQECSSEERLIRQLQSAAVQEIDPRVYEITSTLQAFNELKLLIKAAAERQSGVVSREEIRLLWVSLEIVESEDV